MESIIERHAVRAAVAVAAASAHGRSAEVIADLRDEAAQLIGLCTHPAASPDELRVWCDDAITLITRCISAGGIAEEHVLPASAAVLRLRLAAARDVAQAVEKEKKQTKPTVTEAPKPKSPELTENQRKVIDCITEHPGIRSKDLTVAMSGSFSVRSMKRYLAELISLGIIRRTQLADGSVTYTIKS